MPTRLPSYLPLPTRRVPDAVSLAHAVEESPTLASLTKQAQRSVQCLKLVAPLVPANIRESLKCGSLENDRWCVLVPNNAVAAKLRQIAPALTAHLRAHGQNVQELRIKIVMPTLK